MIKNLADHRMLIDSLLQGASLTSVKEPRPQLIETHISSVLITGDYVYKLKKPLDLGFLDFSTLSKRKFYCEEEIRLNKRLSPQIYLDVMAVTGTLSSPELNGDGDVLEYLVRMRPFSQQCQLDRMLERGALSKEQVTAFAGYIATFHQSAARVEDSSDFGSARAVFDPVRQNFIQIKQRLSDEEALPRLEAVSQWSHDAFERLKPVFNHRRHQGYVRECHGDLHLRNLAWFEGKPMAFDCIEFNPNLYCIDVINDIAFLIMDLWQQQRQDLAMVFLNRYLEVSGDFPGLSVLRFYLVYRAMVRAKIDIIQATQEGVKDEKATLLKASFNRYLQLALDLMSAEKPGLFIMFGPSGSGKSTLAQQLSRLVNAVIIRSDVERKRLFSASIEDKQVNDYGAGIYSAQATAQTYARLVELSGQVLESGFAVIVDATFQDYQQRRLFQAVTENKACDFVILDLQVSEQELIRRVRNRKEDVSDADISVLKQQLADWQPLTAAETSSAITVKYDQPLTDGFLLSLLANKSIKP